jgi:hypothetical protein
MYMPLARKQVYLDVGSHRKIQRLAKATGLSEAEHIRRAIARYVSDVPDEKTHPLLAMVGLCDAPEGPVDAAIHHDAYLYGRKR